MEFKDFANKIGTKYNIVNGELAESDTGKFTVSETFGTNTIYINKLTRTCTLITASNTYIGRPYKLKRSDCIDLVTEWLDKHLNTSYTKVYAKTSRKDLLRYLKEGMSSWFKDNEFTEVTADQIQTHDCVVYTYDNVVTSHIGVYIGNNNLLHHIPDKLSSIDTLDTTKILGVYRYAK